MGGAAEHRQLLLGHAPLKARGGDHAADVGEALLVVAPQRLGALADPLAHALEGVLRQRLPL